MMLELAEHHAEVGDKPTVLDGTREEDVTATKEAIGFLFKQIMSCISEAPPLYELPGDVFDKDSTDKDLIITQYKSIIKQLQETNKEIINKQSKQMHALKEHFENLRTCVDLRELYRQKLEFSSGKLKAEIAKIKQQVAEYEQKTEIKALHHSEDVHALQQLVHKLVSGEARDTNVLSMSQGGSLFQNPNAPTNLRDTAPLLARDPLRENGIPASLHSLFDSKLRPTATPKHSSSITRGRMDLMDTDVVVSGEHEANAVAGSLRELHEITRAHHIGAELDKDVLVVDSSKIPSRDVYEIPRDIREKRDTRGVHEVPRRNEGVRNGSYANYDNSEPSLHIEDEGEEGDRKRLKTDADRQRVQAAKLQTTLRNTHPRSPHMTTLPSPRAQSPLQHPNYHQFQLQAQGQRHTNNTIKKLSSSSGSPPLAIKSEKDQPTQSGAPVNGKKKEPSEIWASEVLLAFSQGTDSPTDTTPPLGASGDLKRRLSSDDVPPPPTSNSLVVVSGGVSSNGHDNSEDPHAALRRISDELAMRRSSGGFDEYSFSRSSGGMSMVPMSASGGHKKRRGKLPETATSLLKRWLLEHQQHPYPTEEEKAGLATSTSLTLNQINNWFTNARRRILPKQKHPGSPPSSPPSSGPTMHHHPHHHHGPHDDNPEPYDTAHTTSNTTNSSNHNNNTNPHHADNPRHTNLNTPTSPPFANHTNYTPNNSTSHPLHNSAGPTHTTSSTYNNMPSLQNPSALLSQLAHTSTLSTPLMAQLTAQLAQRLSANPPPRPAPNPPTILSLSTKRSGELDPIPMEIKSSTEIDDTPTTAPHTISLSSQKIDTTQPHRESPLTISSELSKQTHFQPKFHSSPLRISSPIPPLVKESPSSPPPPTTATLTPTATLTTSPPSAPSSSTPPLPLASAPATIPTVTTSSVSTPTPTPTPTPTHTHTLPSPAPSLTPASTSTPTSRPPIFPSHPLFSQSATSALSALAQLGVSVIPTQPALDPTPQPM